MIAYKVVRVLATGQMRSVFFAKRYGGVLYDLGQTTERPAGQGPIAAFETIRRAQKWATNMRESGYIKGSCNIAIVKCRIKRSKESGLWRNKKIHVKHLVPRGTIFCDRVTPLKMVMDRVGFIPITVYQLAA